MPLTPETLTRHELIGVPIRVADAPNPDLVGISGRVVSETMQTFVVATDSGDKRLPKRGTTFEVALDVPTADQTAGDTDEAAAAGVADATAGSQARPVAGSPSELGEDTAGVRPRQSWPSGCSANPFAGGCEGGVYVTVDGHSLCARPAARTERTGDSKWR
ncbi:ribonuclease P protein component 1 [Halonotius terrestris]|uniref:Ribonuclease P protein component 1 n=1 Tax=Halonotius terrestris TaxID=2487750 RepID=A0A8J8P9L1_9EURY|nr:ribonuclease P protein component 1 [Halonotius terrestris]TQQ81150.1 ribonuclease P protein component 1 [Halonotius terrestris]